MFVRSRIFSEHFIYDGRVCSSDRSRDLYKSNDNNVAAEGTRCLPSGHCRFIDGSRIFVKNVYNGSLCGGDGVGTCISS